MAPVKFGDIAKVATETLDDDYQAKGIQFKNKTKTTYNAAVITTTVDVNSDDKVQTPAKLSWKFPNAFGIKGLNVDKLEMDKAGKLKCEAACEKDVHKVKDLKVEVKSDLVNFDKTTLGFNYTGLADTLVILETPPMKPDAFNLELMRTFGPVTAGAKLGMANMTAPDVGCRFVSGPMFASLLATSSFSVFKAHCHYKVNDALKVGAFYEQSKKPNGGCGIKYELNKDISVKSKITMNQDVLATVKYGLCKGFSVLAGASFNLGKGFQGWGLQVSLE